MLKTYPAKITKIGNSKGVRLPKEIALFLGTDNVLLEVTKEGVLIRPAPAIEPLEKWASIMASIKVESETEFLDWDITLTDGLDKWED